MPRLDKTLTREATTMKMRTIPGTLVLVTMFAVTSSAETYPGDKERKEKMSPGERAWEKLLEQNLGRFYLPRYKEAKAKGAETAWDYVKDDPNLPRVLLIGDSISRGYTMPVRHALKGKVNVHRAPENCGKTANGLKKLDIWLGDKRWDLVHFNFGIHDRKLRPEYYGDRLEMIVERLKPTTDRLVFATSTPIAKRDERYIHGSSARSNKIAKEIMERQEIPVNDLYALMLPVLKKYQNPRDCHFTPEGYEVLGQEVAEEILRELEKPAKRVKYPAATAETEALIFSDGFDREALGKDWHVYRGQAAIKDNALYVEGPAGVSIRPSGEAARLGRNLRVEYDAVSGDPGDLSLLLNVCKGGDANDQHCVSTGYFFGVASEGNKICKIMAFGKELARRKMPAFQPGQKYHVTVEKNDGRMRILIDGREVVRAENQKLVGAGSLGFYVWNSGTFDNLEVYRLPR